MCVPRFWQQLAPAVSGTVWLWWPHFIVNRLGWYLVMSHGLGDGASSRHYWHITIKVCVWFNFVCWSAIVFDSSVCVLVSSGKIRLYVLIWLINGHALVVRNRICCTTSVRLQKYQNLGSRQFHGSVCYCGVMLRVSGVFKHPAYPLKNTAFKCWHRAKSHHSLYQ